MLKNSSTLAVSVAINISMKLCFVSVNGPREFYLLDEPRIPRDVDTAQNTWELGSCSLLPL
jgi:hypothetical protein